jgi:hypothetical protein
MVDNFKETRFYCQGFMSGHSADAVRLGDIARILSLRTLQKVTMNWKKVNLFDNEFVRIRKLKVENWVE